MTSTPPLIEAVLFDVDGVIVESELLHLLTFNEILEPFGIHLSESEWKTRFVGAGSKVIMATLFQENGVLDDPAPDGAPSPGARRLRVCPRRAFGTGVRMATLAPFG